MPQITERIAVAKPPQDVYGIFADLPRWTEVLPDTVAVEIFYGDGYNEEFTMTVARPAGLETVRGIRYRRPPEELELVQTLPPPGFVRMSGTWRFTPTAEGTEVTAVRSFELGSDDPRDPDQVAAGLGRILQHNLDLFRQAVESDGRD